MRVKSHAQVSFEVTRGEHTRTFTKFPEAVEHAFVLAAGGDNVTLDVLAWSRAGAKAWGGDDGAEVYDEDPEASVFERYELTVNFVGRVA
jgi:hypothetical protein